MNELERKLTRLSERGMPRGADAVLASARISYLSPSTSPKRGPLAAVAACAAVVLGILALSVVFRDRDGTTSVSSESPDNAETERRYVVPGELPFETDQVTFDEYEAANPSIDAPRLVVWVRRPAGGSPVTSAVAAQVLSSGQSGSLAVEPVNPSGRPIALSPSVTAKITEPSYGFSGLTILSWDTAAGQRVRVAGRGVAADELSTFAMSLLDTQSEVDLDLARAPQDLTKIYDGPDHARPPRLSGVDLHVKGAEGSVVDISVRRSPFSVLGALGIEPEAVLVDVRGRQGVMTSMAADGLVSLKWAESDDLMIVVTVAESLRDDLLTIANHLRLVDASGWKDFLASADATATPSSSMTTTVVPGGG